MTDTIADLHELRSMRAAWLALSRRWELTGRELCMLLPQRGEDTPAPPGDTERRMRLMLILDHRLPSRVDRAEVRDWLRTSLGEFGGLTPLEVMARGPAHIRELRRFAEWTYRS